MIYNYIKLHDMDTEPLSSPLSDFGKDTMLIQSAFGNSQSIYGLSLPSGLRCVMSYLMQTDKQYACTDSIKETKWDTHMGGLYKHFLTHTHTLHFASPYHTQFTCYFIVWSEAIHSNPHLLRNTTSNAKPWKPLDKHLFLGKSPIRCATCCLVTCTLWLNHQICKVMTSITISNFKIALPSARLG